MNILSIAFKDLLIFFKDRGAALQIFVLPLVFILVFAGIGNIGADEPEAIALPVLNLDTGKASETLLRGIDAAGGVKTELMAEAETEAETQLEAGEINWLLKIPADFSTNLAANKPVVLPLVAHPDADDTEKEAVRLVIDGAAQELLLQTQIRASLEMMGAMQAASEHPIFTTERIVAQAESQFEGAEERPLITIQETRPGQIGKEDEPEPFSGPNVTVPGFTVLFVFLAAGSTALSIYNEKKVGSFRRLMAAPISKAELLLGKMLPAFIIAVIQVVVIFIVGMFVLPLFGLDGLTLGEDPLAVALIVVVMALCAAGLGVLIAAFAKTEGQIGGGAAVLLWAMGALGGAFFPTFLLEGFLGQAGKAVPHYWAGKALYGVMARGQTLTHITTELAILFGFTVLFWLVGVWQFDFD
ncbi:MAG: ABC transporter permease [Chloroflexi bacterium]|nr:ABC transporter permease [Chloroflexota bacterium]